jgi:hypothetical protein
MQVDYALREDWIKALESGEYQQCFGRMNGPNNTFCAIGVLRRVADKRTKNYISALVDYYEDDRVISLNDKKAKSFKEIAKYLRNNTPDTPWKKFKLWLKRVGA